MVQTSRSYIINRAYFCRFSFSFGGGGKSFKSVNVMDLIKELQDLYKRLDIEIANASNEKAKAKMLSTQYKTLSKINEIKNLPCKQK